MAQRGPRPFINTTPLEQPGQASRRNARSYAMRGKNSGKRRKHLTKKPCIDSWINGQFAGGLCQDPGPVSQVQACTSYVPRQVASEWSLFKFAEEPGPHVRQKLYQFFPILEHRSYPNQILATNFFDRQASLWFEHLGQSQTYVHNQLFVAMSYFDIVVDKVEHIGQGTISHMTKALSLLQTDLATIDRATAEVTIATVIAFAMVAVVSGDTASAGKHHHGLFKVLNLRGGLASLKSCRYLQIKCCRLDLSYAMPTCSKPLFFVAENILWDSYLPRSLPVSPTTAIHLLVSDSEPDPIMVNIWFDLHEFSRAANIAAQTGRKLEPDLLQEVMISVQYRLLNLEYDMEEPHELLRVVMLAYSATILPLLCSQFGAPASLSCPSFPACLHMFSIANEESSNDKLKALLWLLIIAEISILDVPHMELQLAQTIRALILNSWDEILELLKGFLWIDTLHREPTMKLLSNTIIKTEGVMQCVIS
ncbi:uncharacterized protein LY89DRAFT_776211 [Mollisia scopiformis]|uniref:Uncharacterized protein n=1 Tax=Mollisia scopiformis TaxID=149040 RepID=A0A194XVH6_MOLSC|nr:uncharacterized protein LY89DRAFT_776211 [Mollisia scopiformis]KUJ24014.1 hypothetical protein LY89DRAFT_776211 [Mollisia scopiformis]